MAWMNNDGLYIKYGTEEAQVGKGGSYEDFVAGSQVTEIVFDLANLSTSAQTILDDNLKTSSGWRIQSVQIEAITPAVSGGASTLDIGIVRSDRSTEEDFDGLVAALAKTAIDTAGETSSLSKGSTGAGALIGTTLASTAKGGYLVAKAGTAAFTSGRVKVLIYASKSL